MAKEPTFEENLNSLEQIVAQLEKGDVPLEQALAQFQTGVKLSQHLQGTLENAEKTLAKMMDENGQEVPFEKRQAKLIMKPENTLQNFEEQWLPAINQFLELHLENISDRQILTDALRYSVLAGGKRLRPLLTLAVLTDFKQPVTKNILQAACSVELIHTYSLIHDDLPAMDNDQLRRGQATSHVKFGEANAILAGDALQPLAFEWLSTSALPDAQIVSLTRMLAQAAGANGMVAGQVADVNDTGITLKLADLQQLHREKTGALVQYAVAAGAVMSQVDSNTQELLAQFAAAFGLAFQICDDILDVTASTASLGKQTHKDAAEDKNTYPALLGLDGAKAALAAAIRDGKKALKECTDLTGQPLPTLTSLFGYFEIIKER